MATEIGEFLVGAYLKVVEGCQYVDYNMRFPGGGLKGLEELDVIGFDFKEGEALLCEVTTHIQGLLIGSGKHSTLDRVARKFEKQRQYADENLKHLPNHRFMFWSPVVPRGQMLERLKEIEGLEVIVNEEYGRRIETLRGMAKKIAYDTGNPAFRLLQILARVKSQ